MAGVTSEAENAYSSGTPGSAFLTMRITPVLFERSTCYGFITDFGTSMDYSFD